MKTCKRKKSYPDWAKYMAYDINGELYLCEYEPSFITIDGIFGNPTLFTSRRYLFASKKSKKHKMAIFRIED